MTEKHGLDYCLNMIEQVINETKLPQENEYINENKELIHKNKLQAEKIKHLEEMNKQLRDNLNDLRRKNKIIRN